MLKIGDVAPDFNLPSETGKNLSLKDFGKKRLVLYFFPKADTPG
jgi:peroxiredoxin Q/BCP